MTPLVADIVRAFVLIASGLIAGQTAIIIGLYFFAARRRGPTRRGLLPHHVWLIGTSYVLFVVVSVARVVERISLPPDWILGAILGAHVLGLFALTLMLVRLASSQMRVVIKREDIEQDRGLS